MSSFKPNSDRVCKNSYLMEEMKELEEYLNRVPIEERFFNSKIVIRVEITNPTSLNDDQFSIIQNNL